MKKIATSTVFLFLFFLNSVYGQIQQFSVSPSSIHNGYVVEKLWLNAYVLPTIRVVQPSFTAVAALPKDVIASTPQNIKLTMGMERKRAFVYIAIPAYSKDAQGNLQQLKDYRLDITQAPAAKSVNSTARTTQVSSPLASGIWYKIAVPSRGVYKVDGNFLQSKLGISLSSVNPANIRVFGNGGAMLSENNAVAKPYNLVENAIVVNAAGSTFGASDYFLFYADGPMAWDKDSTNQQFIHRKNLYADSSYYFINVDQGAGLRMSSQSGSLTSNETITSFNDYQVHEVDLFSPGKVGKLWLGEDFGTLSTTSPSRDFSFSIGALQESLNIKMFLASTSASSSKFNVSLNGQTLGNYFLPGIPSGLSLTSSAPTYSLPNIASTATFHLVYTPSAFDGLGYLDYIELNYRRTLSFPGGQLNFRDWRSVGTNKVANYQLQNANSGTQVWDITNPLQPVKMNGALNGSTYSFTQEAGRLHEFVTLDGSQYGTPQFCSKIDNQNIHGNDHQDLVIVTYPGFLEAANKLADYHRTHDNFKVLVVTTTQVYNEFSSGGQDIGAIRDMMRMFYANAGNDTTQLPRYLLLFGDASYDYKDRVKNNTNFVPTFESAESVDIDNGSYTVDDFFGTLDDNENIEDDAISNTLDIGVGRLPVGSETEAMAMVDKIINYTTNPATFGPWRLANTYMADNEDDAGTHLMDAEDMQATVNATTNIYNDSKIYLDNLPFVSTPAGDRCPQANKLINDAIYKGTFLMNYNGHGSTVTLAHERILTADDFNAWTNINKLPFMVTATCDYSRYDDPTAASDGERLILKANGGTIAMLTTTAAVYATINHMINVQFLQAQFNQHNGQWYTFGDAFRIGKNITYVGHPGSGTLINFRRFVLLGDPALQPCFPKHFVHTDAIVDATTLKPTDTLKALGSYKITGNVADVKNNILTDFNGKLYVTIYDKPRTVSLRTKVYDTPRSYTLQDNIIYKGIATVQNGLFSFSFIAPKDLNYDFGKGKISYYAENGITDAAGSDFSKTVGGYSDNPIADDDGPIVKPYMNDTLFRDGAITGSNTVLYVKLWDKTGINVTGNSIGHDLTAILDGDESTPYNLNDYYETDPNTYQSGHLSFPVNGLAVGKHKFTVKAWDVNNNSGTGTVNFVVGSSNELDIQNLMNYPNPFGDVTHFIFEHNHPNEKLNVKIMIYSISGQMVKLIEQTFTPDGSHSNELTWDGTNIGGAKLPNGVYPYRMILSTDSGIQGSAYQKLVLYR